MKLHLRIGACASALAGLALIAGCPFFPLIPAGDATSGETLWNANNCLTCHGNLGCGGSAPDIRSVTFGTLDPKLRDAATAHTGGKQESMSDQDIADLAAYLNSVTDDDCALSQASVPSKTVNFALISTHDPASSDYNASCTSCHGERTNEGALDGATLSVHSAMPGRLGSGDQRCLTCHSGGVDLVFNTTSRLRDELIAQSGCASSACHGATGALPFFVVDDD